MLTQNYLKLHFDYNTLNGDFTRKYSCGGQSAGDICNATRKDGYKILRIQRKLYLQHRLAWLYVHGEMPNVIDHIDGNPNNNSISNLRNVNQYINLRNKKRNGMEGIWYDKKRGNYMVRIWHNGEATHLGRFKDLKEAKAVRAKATEKNYYY